ncbi:MAG TPA: right-handed parallel beta-helix repeat-containing protein [Clostridia bacterium]|nr:right-handed parallel beta-helix repeat-containing protein [Clostridia bacterium]
MSIQSMIDAASPGSTVNVPPGTYNEQLLINKPLTLQGPPAGGGTAIIDAGGLPSLPTILILNEKVSVIGLTIQNGPLHGIQVGDESTIGLTDVNITNNHISGHGNAGILTNYGAAMDIISNVIENNGVGEGFNRVGIVLYPHGITNVFGNTVNNNMIDGIFARASATGLVIENNTVSNHSNSGITLAWDQRNTIIFGNTITDCGAGSFDEQGGIVIIQSTAEIMQENVIRNCKPSGIFWGWVPTVGNPPNEILIDNNKIENSTRDAIYLFSQGAGGFIPPDLFPLKPTIRNNTLVNSGRAGVYVSNSYYYGPGSADPTINCNDIVENEWGVINGTAHIVDAVNNWWGDSSGPYNPQLNPGGAGNPVSDNVDFTPWLKVLSVIQIVGCSIKNVTLVDYKIRPPAGETIEVDLVIKIAGDVTVKTDEGTRVLNFETRFAKKLNMRVPNFCEAVPKIDYTAVCYAVQDSNAIQAEIELCIVVNMVGQYCISIPSSYPCVPRNSMKFGLCRKTGTGDCINAEVVFDSCWFGKNLSHNVALPTQTC